MGVVTFEELHLELMEVNGGSLIVAFHGCVKTVALELVDKMFSLFEAVSDKDAFAVIVNLEHVVFGLLARPAENLLEDMCDKVHRVDRIVPANNQVTSFVSFAGFFFWPF